MKLDHIGRIRGNIQINTKIKATNILDGSYKSIFKGKSLNFEELREYNIGDSVKDIDWRASARSTNLLVREYVAEKKHNVMFVLDGKYSMNANCSDKDLKRDVAIDVAGTLAYLAYKNGDYVGSIYMYHDNPVFFPAKQSLFNIENFLTYYDENMKSATIKDKYVNSINDSLKYVTDYFSKKSVFFIITDLAGLEEIDDHLIKTLALKNDVMIVNIGDVSLFEKKSYDLDKKKYFSQMFLNNTKLLRLEQEEKSHIYEELVNRFTKYKITTITVNSSEEIISKIIELLEKHRNIGM